MKRLAFAGVLIAGCTVGPDWRQPKVETPPAWRIDYAQAAQLANARWWRSFGDPVLDQLVEESLRNNRDLVQAAARVDQFLGALSSTRSQFYPQIGYAAEATRGRTPERSATTYDASLSAAWQIDLFGWDPLESTCRHASLSIL